MRISLPCTIIAAALALVGCSRGYGGISPDAGAVTVQTELPPPDVQTTQPGEQIYRLGAYDTVTIRVFGAEELNLDATVGGNGAVTVPLIGEVQAAGLTTAELGQSIADRLRGRFLRNPQVSVDIKEIRSQRVTIDGAVNQPGVYPVLGNMTLIRAIATARGTTEFAATERVAVFRTVNNQRMAALFSLRDIREGRYTDPTIYANDVIVVGESGSRRFWRDLVQAIPVLGVFTPLAN